MIGSRYVPGGGVEGEFNLKRKFMSTGINLYARMFLGLSTKDNSGSFRCYRVSKLAEMDFDRILSRGYSFMEEILFWCRQVGCTFGETPILFENRRAGLSRRSTRWRPSAPYRSSPGSAWPACSAWSKMGQAAIVGDRSPIDEGSVAIVSGLCVALGQSFTRIIHDRDRRSPNLRRVLHDRGLPLPSSREYLHES